MVGKIISFEGIDGAGKSTYLYSNKLILFLKKFGIDAMHSSEFTQNSKDLREKCREILLSKIDPIEELLIISFIRRWHYRNIIKPLLDKGIYILMDRFIDSTYAYQGGGSGIDKNIIEYFEKNFWLAPKPDITIYFESTNINKQSKDRIESNNDDYFDRVKNQYNKNKTKNWICVCRDKMTDLEIEEKIENNIIKILKL